MLCSTLHIMVLLKWVIGILQMRVYALYHCSKKLLVFMVIGFVGEVGTMVWMLISSDLSSRGTLLAFFETSSTTNSDRCGRDNILAPDFIPGIWGDWSMFWCSVWGVHVHLGPLSHFRGYVVFTCYLCWYQTLEGTIAAVNENHRIAIDWCSDPSKCHLFPQVGFLMSSL